MPNLLQALTAPSKRQAVVADSVRVLDQEVDDKGGLSGMAIKAAYKLVKGVKPGFVPDVIDALLDDFCKNLQPIVDEAEAKGSPLAAHLEANRGRVAEALLAITDERARRSKHATIKAAYERLRGKAKDNVEAAVPRVSAMLQRHVA